MLVETATEEDKTQEIPDIDDEDSSEEDEVILFVDQKYCTICHVEQPLRCKHCKNCDQCVAMYDHHCPWIGVCVGERNKFRYWCYLIV
jgi:palmitoyltransferase